MEKRGAARERRREKKLTLILCRMVGFPRSAPGRPDLEIIFPEVRERNGTRLAKMRINSLETIKIKINFSDWEGCRRYLARTGSALLWAPDYPDKFVLLF